MNAMLRALLVGACVLASGCETEAAASPAPLPASSSNEARPGGGAGGAESGASVRDDGAPEVEQAPQVEPLRIVKAQPQHGALGELLLLHAAKARRAGLRPVVEMHAGWCKICQFVDRQLAEPRAAKTLAGVYLIRVDTDAWQPDLKGAGLTSPTIPAFYELDPRGRPTRMLSGHRWPRGSDAVSRLAGFLAER